MRVKDLVRFNKETFFNGAVQTEWFYDAARVKEVAESYVFHGPKYYGVSMSDVGSSGHKLIDTASFAKRITEKLYGEGTENCFVMTIAGYGTGKSHLAVCLGALFSGNFSTADRITDNISAVDEAIGAYIRQRNAKRNLVIVLNGMNNFNLDAEVLRCVRLSLAQHGISDEPLKRLTRSYNIARHFVTRTFSIYQAQFEAAAAENNLRLRGEDLRDSLIANVESDSRALLIIDTIYAEVNGDHISWDRGLSAGDVLRTLQDELCGEGRPFHKILLLFDEFGRYIEYTAANPAIAGEAALQQIFEASQSANGKIVFVGFIQSELEAYLARIEKTSNITRYLERYRTASENLFLSTNFETILANILLKADPAFQRTVGDFVERYKNYHSQLKSALVRWDRSSIKKSVWTEDALYNQLILHGCYPLHPITVWLLSNAHQWMQQRSTLVFAAEMVEEIAENEVNGSWLPYVYPVQIIDSGIFAEMLNSEEKGLVSSQYCMLYRDILVRVGDKLSEVEKTVLKAVLVINIGRMMFYNKANALNAIQYCSNLQEKEVQEALKSLEDMHGVVAFDDHANTYDLIAEANGFNEFKRIFFRYRMGVNATIEDLDDTVRPLIGLDQLVETSFAQDHHISSTEWAFQKVLLDSGKISDQYLRTIIRNLTEHCDGERFRGVLLYAYCSESPDTEAERLSRLYRTLDLKRYPIIILFLDDSEKAILSALMVKKALLKFSAADKERFKKHIYNQQRNQNNQITRRFTNCVTQRVMIEAHGKVSYSVRLNALCTQRFAQLYNRAVPFVFDGFENKSKVQAKTTLTTICCYLYNRTLMNVQVYNALPVKDKNRIISSLATKSPYSWKVFDNNCHLVEPLNPLIHEIIQEIVRALEDGQRHTGYELFYPYTLAPYGMNENSIALLISYFIAYQENRYRYYLGEERLGPTHWSDAKGKLKIPELRKVLIQKNMNAYVDVVGNLCREIMSNTNVEVCVTLKEDLNQLIIQEGESAENQYKIAQARVFLDDGIRLSRQLNTQYAKAKKLTDDLKEKFSILASVKALEAIPIIKDELIEEGLKYRYSDVYKRSIAMLRADVAALLESRYLPILQTATCKITELSQFETSYRRVAAILRTNHYDQLADATEQRVQEIEKELLAKQQYQNILADIENDLAQSRHTDKYRECNALLRRLETWKTFIKEMQALPPKMAEELLLRLQGAVEQLQVAQEAVLQEYSAVIRTVSDADTAVALEQVNARLEHLREMQLDEAHSQEMILIQGAIREALDIIQTLPGTLDELEGECPVLSEAAERFCGHAVRESIRTLKAGLEERQANWMRNYVTGVEQACRDQAMSVQQCQAWLEKAKNVPAYFSSAAKGQVSQVRQIVEAQLHRSRVDRLLMEYDELTAAEKDIFKKLLSERL